MKLKEIKLFIAAGILLLLFACSYSSKNENIRQLGPKLARTPPMGWNSFDSYGVYLHEKAALANLEAFAVKLKPHGYEYFVIDAGWFGEFELQKGTMFPAERHAKIVKINDYGLLQPSDTYFPNGLQQIIDRCHELGLKFGIHLMRGIPRIAVEQNTPIKETQYHASDIVDTINVCSWNKQNYGVDMSRPGAQEFYNSLINQMADWGVDFIKYDDIVPYPKEVEAVVNAIAQCGRPIVLSLSPGNIVKSEAIEFYKKSNLLRVTSDIWDDQHGIDKCFLAWRKWQGMEEPGFWIDMDMIPFGKLQLMNPDPATLIKDSVVENMSDMEKNRFIALAGKGHTRLSELSNDQMYTFITMRALAASPLMMGGDLPTLDDFSLSLITNKEMLACNQNGVMGTLLSAKDGIEIWNTPKKESENGWIGIFNRSENTKSIRVSTENLGLSANSDYKLLDVWLEKIITINSDIKISPGGVTFIRYEKI